MEEKIISSMSGVGVYGLISIGICFVFFTGTALWAFGLKRSYVRHMRELPLDGGDEKPKNLHPSSGT